MIVQKRIAHLSHFNQKNSFVYSYTKEFLLISDNVKVDIDYSKIVEDAQWDGLKGYITNTSMTANDVYTQYSELCQVERAFRVTKGILELRPMFHFTE